MHGGLSKMCYIFIIIFFFNIVDLMVTLGSLFFSIQCHLTTKRPTDYDSCLITYPAQVINHKTVANFYLLSIIVDQLFVFDHFYIRVAQGDLSVDSPAFVFSADCHSVRQSVVICQ